MRHLIVCCDGTWQTMASRSNTGRLADAVAPAADDGTPQVVKYVSGVGTALGTRLLGGITGWGLSDNVIAGYTWLAREYRPGDAIWLFGFSRGAYAARSLAGMIGSCGLLDGNTMEDQQLGRAVDRVYSCYRAHPNPDPRLARLVEGLRFHYRPDENDGTPIRFIGVWDTVGGLGIPTHLGPGLIDPFRKRYEFHDVKLDPRIPHARHAVAIDEMRGPFSPTLWQDPEPGQDMRQVWFPGDHLDVGGGHRDTSLSDGALLWMMDEASGIGLAFDKRKRDAVQPNPAGRPAGRGFWDLVLEPIKAFAFAPRPRIVPRIDANRPTSDVHGSAYERQRAIDYRPTRTLDPGASQLVDIPDLQQWSETGLYVEPGDHTIPAEPGAGRPTGLLRRILGGTGELEGVVANETTNVQGEVDAPHERVVIRESRTSLLRVTRPGYLYAYGGGYPLAGQRAARFTVSRL